MSILRIRKNSLVASLKAYELSGKLTREQAEGFRLMYAKARSLSEQDQVTAALHHRFDGWQTGTDRFSKILQNIAEARKEQE